MSRENEVLEIGHAYGIKTLSLCFTPGLKSRLTVKLMPNSIYAMKYKSAGGTNDFISPEFIPA